MNRTRPPIPLNVEFEARFWAKVKKTESCWIWLGGRSASRKSKGIAYGVVGIRHDGKNYNEYAHRVAWALKHKRQPGKRHILHERKCTTKLCVRHLYDGTHADNMADYRSTIPGVYRFNKKLNPNKVRRIRSLAAGGVSRREIARKFGVAISSLSPIIRGEYWVDVK